MEKTYFANGKKYRVIRKPESKEDAGHWEFFYNGKWNNVVSRKIRIDLNKKFGFYDKKDKRKISTDQRAALAKGQKLMKEAAKTRRKGETMAKALKRVAKNN